MGNPKKRISVSNRLFLINGGTAVADLNPMAFNASGTCDDRIWGERQPHLGRATNASGTCDERIWDERRALHIPNSQTSRVSGFSCYRFRGLVNRIETTRPSPFNGMSYHVIQHLV